MTFAAADTSNRPPQFYLASRSPRRAELLTQLGLHFVVVNADIDESVQVNEEAASYVMRLALEKAQAGQAIIAAKGQSSLPVLAADTTVCVNGQILGKPANDEDALQMLQSMVGKQHAVHTGVAIAFENAQGQLQVVVKVSTTQVEFADVSDATLRAYIATGEPRDKAGAYGIQGLASTMIKRIEGSYSGVMGLPIYETTELLNLAGVHVL